MQEGCSGCLGVCRFLAHGYRGRMADVVAEVAGRTLKLTNLEKVLYPSGFTKGEVIDYYRTVAPVLLPHLARRPVTRVRFPHGTTGASFFEKNVPAGAPPWLQRQIVDGSEGEVVYPLVDGVPALVYLANLAALELHSTQWRTPDPDAAVRLSPEVLVDQVVVDLDPGAGVTMPLIATAALLVAGELGAAGLAAFAKTSGSKGIQVYAPVQPTPAGDSLGYVQGLAEALVSRHPELFVTAIGRDARVGRLLLDVNQNLPGRTTVSVYSLRARDTPTVSAPVTWEEVEAAADGAQLSFTAPEVLARVESRGDLFSGLLAQRRGVLPARP